MLQATKGVLGVVGRVMLCGVFIAAALGYAVPSVKNVAERFNSTGFLGGKWALVGGIALLVLGSISIAVGYKARVGALLLLAFLILATYSLHGFSFWASVNAQARQEHVVYLLTNLSMMGAMLFIVANGSGPMSLDAGRSQRHGSYPFDRPAPYSPMKSRSPNRLW